MNAELRDVLRFMAPAMLPVFADVTLFRYPALPLRIAKGNKNYSLLQYVFDKPNVLLTENKHSFMPAPRAYAMMKTEELVLFNMDRIHKVRVDRKYPASIELACV